MKSADFYEKKVQSIKGAQYRGTPSASPGMSIQKNNAPLMELHPLANSDALVLTLPKEIRVNDQATLLVVNQTVPETGLPLKEFPLTEPR